VTCRLKSFRSCWDGFPLLFFVPFVVGGADMDTDNDDEVEDEDVERNLTFMLVVAKADAVLDGDSNRVNDARAERSKENGLMVSRKGMIS